MPAKGDKERPVRIEGLKNIDADALLEQELVTDPQAAARLDAIRQLDDVAYDTAFEPPVSDYELDGLDLER